MRRSLPDRHQIVRRAPRTKMDGGAAHCGAPTKNAARRRRFCCSEAFTD
jgi:hypothetical protein